MMSEDFIKCLKFVNKHCLGQKEIDILLVFNDELQSAQSLSELLGNSKRSVYVTLQKLKYKGLILLSKRSPSGTSLYELFLNID